MEMALPAPLGIPTSVVCTKAVHEAQKHDRSIGENRSLLGRGAFPTLTSHLWIPPWIAHHKFGQAKVGVTKYVCERQATLPISSMSSFH